MQPETWTLAQAQQARHADGSGSAARGRDQRCLAAAERRKRASARGKDAAASVYAAAAGQCGSPLPRSLSTARECAEYIANAMTPACISRAPLRYARALLACGIIAAPIPLVGV